MKGRIAVVVGEVEARHGFEAGGDYAGRALSSGDGKLFLLLERYRFGRVDSIIAQDGGVDAVREINVAEVGVGADPVVINGLVRSELENKRCRSLTSD